MVRAVRMIGVNELYGDVRMGDTDGDVRIAGTDGISMDRVMCGGMDGRYGWQVRMS
jgi:hypothetical protein